MGSSQEESPWGRAPGNESVLINLVNSMHGVKPCLGSGWVSLISAPPCPIPLQHTEIPMEAFKSRTFPRKTFCNTSSVLSRQERLLAELSPEGSSLQSGTLPPRYGDRAPRGALWAGGGRPPAHSSCATAAGWCGAGSFPGRRPLPPLLQGSTLGFRMGFFGGQGIFSCN